jgi:sulfatase modifying factor 1
MRQADSAKVDSAKGDSAKGDSGKDTEPPSCAGGGDGASECGIATDPKSCCASLAVPGGLFHRSYDDVTYKDESNPATVAAFRLDQFEVTVGRFRKFVKAVEAGWVPPAGGGKHLHLNGGQGLATTSGGFEQGWSSSWPLASQADDWNTNLVTCDPPHATWSPTPAKLEAHPINCVNWFEAYAFCIYDEAFLPSEAEWNFAAAGGSMQRLYPWSNPGTSKELTCNLATYNDDAGCSAGTNPVGEKPLGDGLYGQADLAGNVRELVLDTYAPYPPTCDNCVNLSEAGDSTNRGGSYTSVPHYLAVSYRGADSERNSNLGLRCARSP